MDSTVSGLVIAFIIIIMNTRRVSFLLALFCMKIRSVKNCRKKSASEVQKVEVRKRSFRKNVVPGSTYVFALCE